MENSILVILFFSYTFILGFLIHKYLINRSQKYNLSKANTSGERWEQQSKPIFGGITFFTLFIFGIINYIVFFDSSIIVSGPVIAIILSITISFLMGLADDLLNTSPLFKFGMQVGVAIILIYFGIYINIFIDNTLNYLLTIFWVVGIMNSINMLDNMDAITTSTSLIISIIIGVFALFAPSDSIWFYLMILASAYAALGSFLIFNWNPSKMYMGDNGSQFLGAFLAIFSIMFLWNQSIPGYDHPALYKLVTVAIVFAMPLTDTITVSINRLLQGKSPFVGGKDHTTHHLSYAGLSDRKVALVFVIGSIISGIIAMILIHFFPNPNITTLLVFFIYPVAVFSSLYALTRIVKPNK
jgi:UDP-GlcNAc:undecaprenyl-phosphate GlcNAc-1-phosphate transferase